MTRVDTILHHYHSGIQLNIPEEAYCLFPPPRKGKAPGYRRFYVDAGGSTPDIVFVSSHGRRHPNHIHVTGTACRAKLKGLPQGTTVVIDVWMGKGGVKQYRI